MSEAPTRMVDQRLVRWAYMWAAAASEACVSIESFSMPESPATEIGRRDAMTMVLVDAVRNVLRGAELALGRRYEMVRRFDTEHPDLKRLRDRFEHYDEYVMGKGNAQRVGGKKTGKPLELAADGIRISASRGGGPEGHVVSIVVIARDENDEATEVLYESDVADDCRHGPKARPRPGRGRRDAR